MVEMGIPRLSPTAPPVEVERSGLVAADGKALQAGGNNSAVETESIGAVEVGRWKSR